MTKSRDRAQWTRVLEKNLPSANVLLVTNRCVFHYKQQDSCHFTRESSENLKRLLYGITQGTKTTDDISGLRKKFDKNVRKRKLRGTAGRADWTWRSRRSGGNVNVKMVLNGFCLLSAPHTSFTNLPHKCQALKTTTFYLHVPHIHVKLSLCQC